MLRRFVIVILAAALVIAAALEVSAQSPSTFVYQGRLTDTTGTPISSQTSNVVFSIYAAASGGTALWASTGQTISPDKGGVFTIKLGPVLAGVFNGSERYMGIKIGADPEMTPRQVIASTPYAMNANTPGLDWVESGGGTTISTSSATSNQANVTITAPGAGYAIVTGSGSIYWNVATTAGGLIRVRVADAINDVNETTGVQFLRTAGFPAIGVYSYPFSVTAVYPISGAGTYNYYLNMWHQTVNGTALTDDFTLVAMFVPTRY